METPNLPNPTTTTEILLFSMLCELQRLNGNVEALIAAKSPTPASPNEGGSGDGADSVVELREPTKRKARL